MLKTKSSLYCATVLMGSLLSAAVVGPAAWAKPDVEQQGDAKGGFTVVVPATQDANSNELKPVLVRPSVVQEVASYMMANFVVVYSEGQVDQKVLSEADIDNFKKKFPAFEKLSNTVIRTWFVVPFAFAPRETFVSIVKPAENAVVKEAAGAPADAAVEVKPTYKALDPKTVILNVTSYLVNILKGYDVVARMQSKAGAIRPDSSVAKFFGFTQEELTRVKGAAVLDGDLASYHGVLTVEHLNTQLSEGKYYEDYRLMYDWLDKGKVVRKQLNLTDADYLEKLLVASNFALEDLKGDNKPNGNGFLQNVLNAAKEKILKTSLSRPLDATYLEKKFVELAFQVMEARNQIVSVYDVSKLDSALYDFFLELLTRNEGLGKILFPNVLEKVAKFFKSSLDGNTNSTLKSAFIKHNLDDGQLNHRITRDVTCARAALEGVANYGQDCVASEAEFKRITTTVLASLVNNTANPPVQVVAFFKEVLQMNVENPGLIDAEVVKVIEGALSTSEEARVRAVAEAKARAAAEAPTVAGEVAKEHKVPTLTILEVVMEMHKEAMKKATKTDRESFVAEVIMQLDKLSPEDITKLAEELKRPGQTHPMQLGNAVLGHIDAEAKKGNAGGKPGAKEGEARGEVKGKK